MFDPSYSRRFEAISAIVDLEGFTPCCTQPDNHRKLAPYLNFVFERVDDSLRVAGLKDSWIHRKFLGDGALYIWEVKGQDIKHLGTQVLLGLHNLYRTFPTDTNDELDELGLRATPRRIRVGIAQGEVTELRADDNLEYVGFSINLAARLQHYCTSIGFLVSCSLSIEDELIERYSLVRAQTKQIRGMPSLEEDVRFVRQDAAHLNKRQITKWFRLLSLE